MLEALHKRLDDQAALITALETTIKVQHEGEMISMELVEGLRSDLLRLTERFVRVEVLYAELATAAVSLTEEVRGQLNGFEEPDGFDPDAETEEQRATRVGLIARVAEIEALVRGRNRSAPVKRNMTDEDAREVLTGRVKDLGHKEAGEGVGLTYAQVYSCRLEYTFKHVHKELKATGWKNPWSAKK